MLCLIVEDDDTSRLVLQRFLMPYCDTEVAADGIQAIDVFRKNFASGKRYDLVCLDIMLPGASGQMVLKEIRALEHAEGIPPEKCVRVIMTTALSDKTNIMDALSQCDAYLVKPVQRSDLMFYLKRFGLVT